MKINIYLALWHIRIRTDELLGAPLHVVRDGEVRPQQEHQEPQHTQPTEMPWAQLPDDAENVLVQVFHFINQYQSAKTKFSANSSNKQIYSMKKKCISSSPSPETEFYIDLDSIDAFQIK